MVTPVVIEPFNIVIAEDDDLLIRVMTVHCRTMGAIVRVAPDAMMALTLIHKQPPDIVMLDINMPAGNGVSVLEMMRTDERLSEIPTIVYSGTVDRNAIQRCIDLGAHYINKANNDWDVLKPLIRSLVYQYRQRTNTPKPSRHPQKPTRDPSTEKVV